MGSFPETSQVFPIQTELKASRRAGSSIQSTLSKTDTFGTRTKCPSYRGVRLIESQIKGLKKGRDQL